MRLILSDPKEDNSSSEQILQYEDLSYCCNKGKLHIVRNYYHYNLKPNGPKFDKMCVCIETSLILIKFVAMQCSSRI